MRRTAMTASASSPIPREVLDSAAPGTDDQSSDGP